MKPRSNSQPKESHSRRLLPAVVTLPGWITTWVAHVSVMAAARMR
jgi:hypothetical protein